MNATAIFWYHTEIIDGVEVEKPALKRLHAIVMRLIMLALSEQTQGTGYELYPELDMLCGPDRYCPDLLVARAAAKFTDDGILDEGAFLAVEILSPGQTIGKLLDKCETYVRNGTEFAWAIWPERRKVWRVTSAQISEASDSLRAGGESSALSPSVPLKKLFANLPDEETHGRKSGPEM